MGCALDMCYSSMTDSALLHTTPFELIGQSALGEIYVLRAKIVYNHKKHVLLINSLI